MVTYTLCSTKNIRDLKVCTTIIFLLAASKNTTQKSPPKHVIIVRIYFLWHFYNAIKIRHIKYLKNYKMHCL